MLKGNDALHVGNAHDLLARDVKHPVVRAIQCVPAETVKYRSNAYSMKRLPGGPVRALEGAQRT